MIPEQMPIENALIKASELGEFEFCRRAWWYRHVKKIEPAHRRRLARGLAGHAQHGATVQTATRWRQAGALLLGIGLLLLAGALLLGVM